MSHRWYIKTGLQMGVHWMVAGAGAAFVYIYPHSFGLKQYEEDMTSTTNGKMDSVDIDILVMAEEIKSELGLTEDSTAKLTRKIRTKASDLLRIIPSKSTELSNKGTMQMIWGSVVAVPAHFSSKFAEEAEQNPDLLQRYNLDLKTVKGKEMFELLKLKENTKLYGLAREICHTNSIQHMTVMTGLMVLFPGWFFLTNGLSALIGFRLLSYLVTVPSVTFGGLKAYDWLNCFTEKRMDTKAASVNEYTARGGLEFYNNLIAKDKLLQESSVDKNESIDYLNISHWFKDYRKQNLSHEERQREILRVIKKLYSKENI